MSRSASEEIIRCGWCSNDPEYIEYHDNEWGVRVDNDRALFMWLTLECFQAGLSWITILKKRQNFKKAFYNWDIKKISRMSDKKINTLMEDKGIIRNRLKINATKKNAEAFLKTQKEFGTFSKYIWGFTANKTIRPKKRIKDWRKLPTKSELSITISKDLKKRGFSFCGEVTVYSYLQAIGMLDDHTAECFKAK